MIAIWPFRAVMAGGLGFVADAECLKNSLVIDEIERGKLW